MFNHIRHFFNGLRRLSAVMTQVPQINQEHENQWASILGIVFKVGSD